MYLGRGSFRGRKGAPVSVLFQPIARLGRNVVVRALMGAIRVCHPQHFPITSDRRQGQVSAQSCYAPTITSWTSDSWSCLPVLLAFGQKIKFPRARA